MITDVIREAKSEHEIYFLLTAYMEAIQFSDKLSFVPAAGEHLPVDSMHGVRTRFEQFIVELDRASKALNHDACLVIKEAMLIFNTALNRLETLASRENLPLPEKRRRELPKIPAAKLHWPHLVTAQSEVRPDC